MIKLSVLIPVYNAEMTIDLLCRTLVALYSEKYVLDIVLVNDCSSDNTDSVCRQVHEEYPGIVTYIKLARNFGEHNALLAGLRHVRGDYCVMMDDDLQNPPEEIDKLVSEIRRGYDVVYTRYNSKKDSLFRNIGSRFNDRIANIILKKPAGLYLSSFKIMNSFLVRELLKNECSNPYIDGTIIRATSNIGVVTVAHREREHSSSGYTFKKLVSLWGNMVVSYSLFPLRVIGMTGTVLIVLGILYMGIKAFDDFYNYGKLTEYETLMSANTFFRGLVLLAVSVLGEYVGRIYLLLNKDPQYVIREVLRSGKRTDKIGLLDDFRARDGRTGNYRGN